MVKLTTRKTHLFVVQKYSDGKWKLIFGAHTHIHTNSGTQQNTDDK